MMTNFDIIKTYTADEFATWILDFCFNSNRDFIETFLNYWEENKMITKEMHIDAITAIENSFVRMKKEAINNWTQKLNQEYIEDAE